MRILFIGLVAMLGACGSNSDSGSTSTPGLFAGTFTGTEKGTQNGADFSQTVTFILQQSGDKVTGTWVTQSGTSGSVEGSASGTSVPSLVVKETDNKCPGTANGALVIGGAHLTGSITGTMTNCGTVSATIDANKQ